MKVIAVMGSARKDANSSTLAQTILDAAEGLGARTESFVLNDLDYKGCIACNSCKTKADHCVLEDDLTRVLDAIKDADAVVFASPVYFSEVSGQFKSAFDRTYSFLNPDFSSRLQPGKKAAFVLSQGQASEKLYADVIPRYEYWLKTYGFSGVEHIRATGVLPPGAVKEKPELLERARETARNWMASQ